MRASGTPPKNLYKRGSVWWARVQVAKRDVRRSLQTSSRSEALKRLKAVLEDAQHIRFYGEARQRWHNAVLEWNKDARESLSANSLKRYLVSLKQVADIIGDVYVDEIDTRTISRIARRSGVSNATRKRDLTAVSGVLRWCAAHGWREDNPARTWDRSVVRERRDPIVLPDPGDIDQVVAIAPGNFAALIRFAQYTGLRQEEAASLTRPQIRAGAIQLTVTKTIRPRAVTLDERAAGTLMGTLPYAGSAFVFWHGAGDRYRNVSSRFRVFVKRAGVRPFRFHDLRHWYAVDYLRRGGSIYTLQQLLGHKSIKTTEIYLGYVTPEEADASKSG